MMTLLQSRVGRLRLVGFLEGISLLALLLVAVPMKYFFGDPAPVKAMGPIHGAIFLLFLLNVLSVSIAQHWAFKQTTWKVLVACLVPLGTFYIDYKILRNLTDHHT